MLLTCKIPAILFKASVLSHLATTIASDELERIKSNFDDPIDIDVDADAEHVLNGNGRSSSTIIAEMVHAIKTTKKKRDDKDHKPRKYHHHHAENSPSSSSPATTAMIATVQAGVSDNDDDHQHGPHHHHHSGPTNGGDAGGDLLRPLQGLLFNAGDGGKTRSMVRGGNHHHHRTHQRADGATHSTDNIRDRSPPHAQDDNSIVDNVDTTQQGNKGDDRVDKNANHALPMAATEAKAAKTGDDAMIAHHTHHAPPSMKDADHVTRMNSNSVEETIDATATADTIANTIASDLSKKEDGRRPRISFTTDKLRSSARTSGVPVGTAVTIRDHAAVVTGVVSVDEDDDKATPETTAASPVATAAASAATTASRRSARRGAVFPDIDGDNEYDEDEHARELKKGKQTKKADKADKGKSKSKTKSDKASSGSQKTSKSNSSLEDSPSALPSISTSAQPTGSVVPSSQPSVPPTGSAMPSQVPSQVPSHSSQPSNAPTACVDKAEFTSGTLQSDFELLQADCGLLKIDALDAILIASNYSDPNVKSELGALMSNSSNALCFTGNDTHVTEQCNGDCCINIVSTENVCKWSGDATVCVGSCKGDKACYDLETDATILPFSCDDARACQELGFFTSTPSSYPTSVTVGPKACKRRQACYKAGVKAQTIDIGYASCTGASACQYLGDSTNGTISIADYACNSLSSCYSMDATESITVGTESCSNSFACFNMGNTNKPKTVFVGESSCVGVRSCDSVGRYVASSFTVTIKDGSCIDESACSRLGRYIENGNVSVGDYACLGIRSCREVARGTRTGGRPESVSVGDGACTEDFICVSFGRNIDDGLVSIAPNTCTNTTTDVCGTESSVNGNAACNGNACNVGDSFILLNNDITNCTFCTA